MLNDVQLWDSKTGKLQGVIERSYRLKFRILSSVRYDSYVSWSSVSDESTNMTTYKTSEYFNRHTLFSHDGHFLLTYDLRQAELWETETGKLIWRTSHHFESSGKWSFSPDGKLLAHVYKVRYRYGDDLPCANWKNAMEIDPDCPDEPPIITIWELRTNTVLDTISGFHTSFLALEFSPDSTMFACIRKDAGLHSKGESRVLEIWATAGFQCIVQSTLVDVILPLVWSPDGKTIGCFSSTGSFRLFQVGTGSVTLQTSFDHFANQFGAHSATKKILALAFSPDGNTLASVHRDSHETFMISLWELGSRGLLGSLEIPALLERHSSVSFSDDGKAIYTDVGRISIENFCSGSRSKEDLFVKD